MTAAITLLGACTPNGGTQTGAASLPATEATTLKSTPAKPDAPVADTETTVANPDTPVANPDSPAGCATADLAVALTAVQGGGGGNKARLNLTLTNKGPGDCTLLGAPGVSFVTGDNGAQVGAPAVREAEGSGTTVTLVPGGSAVSSLTITNADVFDPVACAPADVRGLRVFPPNQTAALFVERPGRTCSEPEKPMMTVGPVKG